MVEPALAHGEAVLMFMQTLSLHGVKPHTAGLSLVMVQERQFFCKAQEPTGPVFKLAEKRFLAFTPVERMEMTATAIKTFMVSGVTVTVVGNQIESNISTYSLYCSRRSMKQGL
jgi:hypothetical protein